MEHEEEHKEEPKEEEKPEEKKSEEPKEVHDKKIDLTKMIRKNPWVLSTFVLGIVVLILLSINFSGGMSGNVVSSTDAGNNLVEYLNKVTDSEVTLISVEDEGNMYLTLIEFKGEEMPLYVTKDGSYYAPNLVPLKIESSSNDQEQQDIPKSDKPEVELFIMTHCPYGTQAEKGIIPTINALGNTINAKIRFVHYFMHEPEETETPIQVCIREEQPDKYLNYLGCFLEDGDSDRCLTKTGIDQTKMNTCIDSGKTDEYYAEDSSLSEGYGVKGSPTLVINGEIVSSGRDSASYLDTICSAFNEAPEECIVELSSSSPSPGFGSGTGSSTTASCN
jgi:glutaredoxin